MLILLMILSLMGCDLNPDFTIPPEEDFTVGTINFASLGIPSCDATLYSGPISNINDNNISTSASTKVQVNSFLYTKIRHSSTFTISFPSDYFITSIRVVGYLGSNESGYVVLRTGGSNNYILYNSDKGNNLSFDTTVININKFSSSISLSLSGESSSSLWQAHAIHLVCQEIYIYGPDFPDSGVRAYKDKTYYLARDVEGVSPLFIGGQRIALGTIGSNFATPFRYYDDGSVYALLKAQGT